MDLVAEMRGPMLAGVIANAPDGRVNYDGLSDEALLALIASSDKNALAALYDRYGRRVFALAARMLGDAQSSEEVTQDVFLSVWRRVSSYKAGKGRFTTWLFSIAHNRTIDELRKRRRQRHRENPNIEEHTDLPSETIPPPEAVVARSESAMVLEALQTLPPEQRSVIEMSYFGGLTQVEIADRTEQPLGTVKTRMRLALKKLRVVLSERIEERSA
ncbi:MAG: sigma-70 family RNA polymerase sigma factor [Chloroflexi bacterium]|nr:sigma-70 family RNA polymerase sigma factor [Chloroflexota bacterium]